MGGFFGVASKNDCVFDLFFGTDYHSHLGTRRGGMAVYGKDGFDRSIHNIENSPFRTKFDKEINEMKGNLGIGCISDYEPQPLIVRSHHGTYAITTVGKINNTDEIVKKIFSNGNPHFLEMSGGDINATELVAAIINQKDNMIDGIRYAHQVNNGWWIKVPPDGTPSGTPDLVSLKGIDNWTVVPYDSSTTIRTNFDVVQHIYTLATHRIIARSKKGVSEHTSVPKNKADVLSEINWLYYCGMQKPPTHHIRKNELMMFVTYTNHQPPAWDITKQPFVEQMTKHYGESCETLERSPSDNMTVNAIFLVEDIHYTSNRIGQFPVEDIQLRCIWTDGAIGKVGKILL